MQKHKCLNPTCQNETSNPKYCSRSCSAIITNSLKPKRIAQKSGKCRRCGKLVEYKKQKRGNYSKRDFCQECLREAKLERQGRSYILSKTLKELKETRNGYWSWRVSITRHARTLYLNSGLPRQCWKCGYKTFFDVCHIKDVSTYDDEAKIKEINKLNNLVALCPNHHKEFDNGLLKLEDIINP